MRMKPNSPSTGSIARKLIASMCVLAVLGLSNRLYGQAQLADELVLLSKGVRSQEQLRSSGTQRFTPGSGGSRLGGEPSALRQQQSVARRDVLAAVSANVSQPDRQEREVLTAPPRVTPATVAPGGPLEIPSEAEDGPADGFTIDDAIGVLTVQNLSLRTRFQEISKSDADILTAGLRGNPLVFGSIDNVPYGSYTPQRPGETAYGITVIQPIDINHKRYYRVIAAEHAKSVVQAQYQDSVRLEIDNLYVAFVDVMAAREDVRYVEASMKGLKDIRETVQNLIKGKVAGTIDLDRVDIQLEAAELAKEEAESSLQKAKRNLTMLLNLPSPELSPFEIRGAIRTNASGLPEIDDLIALSHAHRPDLRAYMLGVNRANAEVDLARKEANPDVFVLYTPWGLRDNTPTGGNDATSWGISAMASIPIFNRNQGNIRRAELSVGQARTEWVQITRRIETEVQQAVQDYQVSSKKVERLRHILIPRAASIREKTLRLHRAGEVDALTYLGAQREYVDIIRQYRDALVAERRAALRINTAVGLRLVY